MFAVGSSGQVPYISVFVLPFFPFPLAFSLPFGFILGLALALVLAFVLALGLLMTFGILVLHKQQIISELSELQGSQ